jgi:uncharacterized protein (TIGR00369 family)
VEVIETGLRFSQAPEQTVPISAGISAHWRRTHLAALAVSRKSQPGPAACRRRCVRWCGQRYSGARNGVLSPQLGANLQLDRLQAMRVGHMTQPDHKRHFGVVDGDQTRKMSGLEFVQGLADGTLPLNPMAETLGYDVVDVSKGRVVVAAEPHAKHRNPFGTVHGGLAATLLDSCMGLAVLSTLEKGFAQVTLEFKISLVRPITPHTGLVKAKGTVISCGRRVGTAEGSLTDREGRTLAHGTTTCLIFEH